MWAGVPLTYERWMELMTSQSQEAGTGDVLGPIAWSNKIYGPIVKYSILVFNVTGYNQTPVT